MKNVTLLIFLIFLNSQTFGQKIFKCDLPINPFDLSAQQGDELYLDVFLKDKKPEVHFYKSVGAKVIVNESLDVNKFGFSNSFSSFFISWEGSASYLSMVYLGGRSWGAYLKYDQAINSLPHETELRCTEMLDVTALGI